MSKIFSYVIKFDTGAAPNPFWGKCTLTICKPIIRKTAEVGDWILGFGSIQVKLKGPGYANYSGKLVFAMKVTEILSLIDYNAYCAMHLPNKIPTFKTTDWRLRLGDCIYDFSEETIKQRPSVHNVSHMIKDLSGLNSLLSSRYYYFGNQAVDIPASLTKLIHKGRGHKIISEASIMKDFEKWIQDFKKNKIYGGPQYRHKYDRNYEDSIASC